MLGGKRSQKSSMWNFFDKLRGEDVVEILFLTKKCKFSVDKLAHANYNIGVVRKG